MNTPVRTRQCVVRATAVLCIVCGAVGLAAQVFTVREDSLSGPLPTFNPTQVELSKTPVGERTRQELIRALQAEQGFAMRPIPMGHKGLFLHANGSLEKGEEAYRRDVYQHGMAAKGGDRVMITDVAVDKDRIVLALNGGPDHKHRFLRHIAIGGSSQPIVRDEAEATGARITLVFDKFVPEMTGQDVLDLLHPLIEFEVKSPKEAYTETLPPKLREAILNHEVLVGMDRKMVYMSKGQPEQKVREQQNGLLFEEWIYGTPPKETEFVRFSGDRVIQTEMAALGKKPVVRATDETDGYLAQHPADTVQLGDKAEGEEADRDHPTLRAPGDPEPANDHSPDRVKLPPSLSQPGQQPAGTSKPPATTTPPQ